MTVREWRVVSEVQLFAYGAVTPILAYAAAVLGSLLGLTCAKRVPRATGTGGRIGWLLTAACALGGTGIWTMHFLAMLGFAVTGSPVRYEIGKTLLSAVIAIAAVGAGMLTVGLGRATPVKIVIAGICTGIGVAGMHYTGMAALRVDGDIRYDQSLVIASVVIAIIASTVALWFTLVVDRAAYIFASALLMGLAVCGMHYTGMAAVSVAPHAPSFGTHGATAGTLLLPIIVLVVLVVAGLFYALLSSPEADDASVRAYLDRTQAERDEQARRPVVTAHRRTGARR